MNPYFLIPVLQIETGDQGFYSNIFEIATSVFSLILFFVTLYAWAKRGKQPTLLIVSMAFLLFFSKQLLEILPFGSLHSELVSSLFDFATLVLFFIALVVRPRRRESRETRNTGIELTDNTK
ncbi:MAG: hypothetical protein ACYC7D_01110 [Nitrososphaerales archaeon]